jgi:hypothetical protein
MSRPTSTGAYVVADLEFIFDREAHARYMEGERDDADAKIGWPFKRVVAASAMALATTGEVGERQFEVVRFDTFGRPEHDERGIVTALFACLHERPDATLVTWAGEFMDLPVLRTAALEHGLRLPAQLQSGAPHLQQRRRRHLDLCISSRGGAKPVHLAEFAIRLGVPAKLAMKAVEVGRAAEQGKWSEVKAQAESDVVTTALLLVATCTPRANWTGPSWARTRPSPEASWVAMRIARSPRTCGSGLRGGPPPRCAKPSPNTSASPPKRQAQPHPTISTVRRRPSRTSVGRASGE